MGRTPEISMGGALRKGNFTDSQSLLFLEVFAFFDQDNNGYIELEELVIVFGNLGVEVTKEELKQKIDDVDVERNGKISFSEFVALMRETITDIHDEKRLQDSFCILSAIPGYMVVPPDMTVLAYRSFLISTSHF